MLPAKRNVVSPEEFDRLFATRLALPNSRHQTMGLHTSDGTRFSFI
jgi:hypothetical protein